MNQDSVHKEHLRKQSHLDLAFASQNHQIDTRFFYEPMLSGHPDKNEKWSVKFGSKMMDYPLWISSMTGGSSQAGAVNKILAAAAKKFRLGMGLGSCRIILEDQTYFEDFNLRPILGDEVPFFANLGIAQVEQLIDSNRVHLIKKLIENLNADGLIIHVNPLQEWLQPEGDIIKRAPIETIIQLMNELDIPLIVKEVGQGFGKESMRQLLKLPLLAIDFAANGGTNFSKLELLRNPSLQTFFEPVVNLGHSAEEMVSMLNEAVNELGEKINCHQIIISGGISNFLDGYYLMSQCKLPAIYGQATAFLKYANEGEEALNFYIEKQIEGLAFAKAFLKIKK